MCKLNDDFGFTMVGYLFVFIKKTKKINRLNISSISDEIQLDLRTLSRIENFELKNACNAVSAYNLPQASTR